ncbi:15416_t:CDS:1 [Dentiscutata erythropus]|uniref:15416_t:CDS:1 n=1 Tax=Dentiscutata erythropus TaxID=1348616 RepID=A0A9N9D1S4_9GLOM|nr:15416_t:CDS:1 [Dentiscutata erythropus]
MDQSSSASTITMTTTATNNNQASILLQDLGAEPLFAVVEDQHSKNSFSNVSVQHAPFTKEPMEARDVYDSLMKRITPSSQAPEQSLSINNNTIQLATPNPISILNELHQRLRTGKLPIYEFLIEPTSGRFDCKLEIFGKTYRTNQPRVRKQQAKEDVALIALKDIVNESTHPAIADSVGQDVLNHFEPPDKNSIAENFMPKSEIWYRKQLSDHPEKKPRVILLEYCQMKRLSTPEYRGRTDERGRYFFDCAIGDRVFSAEGVGFLKTADAKDCIAAKSFSILYQEFCEQERQQEKNNRINSNNLPGKSMLAILPSPNSLPTTSSVNPNRTLTINNSNNQIIQNNCIGLNLSSTANDISTANLVLPSLNDQELQYKNDSHESSRIQSLTASLLPTNSEQSSMPTLSSTNADRSLIPKLSSASTDRSMIQTLPSTNADRSFISTLSSTLSSTSTDRTFQTLPSPSNDRSFQTLPSPSTDRSFQTLPSPSNDRSFQTLPSPSTDRSFQTLPSPSNDRYFQTLSSPSNDRSFPTFSSTSNDRSFQTFSSTSTDRLPSSSSQISNSGYHPYPIPRFPHHQSSSSQNIPTRSDTQAKRFTSLLYEKAQAKRWDRPDFDYKNVVGGFICKVSINNLTLEGKICSKKADAKESAAEIAYCHLARNEM